MFIDTYGYLSAVLIKALKLATLCGSIFILLLIFSCSDSSNKIEIQKHDGIVLIPAADFMMGGSDELTRPDELPRHRVVLDEFWMDETEVTNAQFEKFVQETQYITTAEQKPDWEDLKKQSCPRVLQNLMIACWCRAEFYAHRSPYGRQT